MKYVCEIAGNPSAEAPIPVNQEDKEKDEVAEGEKTVAQARQTP